MFTLSTMTLADVRWHGSGRSGFIVAMVCPLASTMHVPEMFLSTFSGSLINPFSSRRSRVRAWRPVKSPAESRDRILVDDGDLPAHSKTLLIFHTVSQMESLLQLWHIQRCSVMLGQNRQCAKHGGSNGVPPLNSAADFSIGRLANKSALRTSARNALPALMRSFLHQPGSDAGCRRTSDATALPGRT